MALSEWRRFFPPAVEVKETEEYGRGLYASEEIPRGTEILRSEPLVHVLNTSDVDKYCSYCMVPREISDFFGQLTRRNLKKCMKCKFVSYCGKECETKDGFLHKSECKVLTEVKAIHEQPDWWHKKYPHDFTAHVRSLIRMQTRTVEQSTSREIDLLSPNSADLHIQHTGVQSRLEVQYFKTRIGMPGKEEELMYLNCKIGVNSFSVRDQQREKIGFGIYTGPSLLNHACDPNCEQTYDGQTLTLRAIKTIQPGEQLWITYIPLLATYQQRQTKLWRSYRFHCQCHRCLSECEQNSPYHIMYATTGGISEEKKQSVMEEGFSIINKSNEMDDHQVILECQQFLEKYDEVLHPANILNVEISIAMRRAYTRLNNYFKKLETSKRVCDAYRYYPFKDCYSDYGIQLLHLGISKMHFFLCAPGISQMNMCTIAEAIGILSVVLGPHHYITGQARKVQKVMLIFLVY